jgi:hypothetical protein
MNVARSERSRSVTTIDEYDLAASEPANFVF